MAQNDPNWGGKRPNDGPPDLDEIFRKLNQRLSRLLGNRGPDEEPPVGNGGGSGE